MILLPAVYRSGGEAVFAEILKVIFLGVVEGVTEWLPISSTGHMLLVDEFLQLKADDAFKEMFFIVIQLAAILAVVLIYGNRLNPLARRTKGRGWYLKGDVISLWARIIVACIPGAVVTLLFDDWIDAHLHTPIVIAAALIVYGVAFLVIEGRQRRYPRVRRVRDLSLTDALQIGLFQVLAIIPGTSRSGATIIGALLIGVSRVAAAEFTFLMAVPVMFGYSFLKLLKFGFHFTVAEAFLLLIGMVTAFFVSVVVIRFFMRYIRRHSFRVFGWYRIVLGVAVLIYFTFFR